MLSFKILTREAVRSIREDYLYELSSDSLEMLCNIVEEFLEVADEDTEFALAVAFDCAVVRIFNMGRYCFAFPYELSEKSDIAAAISATCEYAMREEIPRIFTDVAPECLSYFSGFRHIDVDAEDSVCGSYRVRIKTECELISEIAPITRGRVELSAVSSEDISLYARLCKDENVNKYWGYDYSQDVENPSDEYFFENAEREFSAGVAMSMAVRVSGEFAGEIVLYAFDGRGGAEFAVRLLPEWQGPGLGTESILALKEVGRSIGLLRLYARIMKDNTASLNMLKKISDDSEEQGDVTVFGIKLI